MPTNEWTPTTEQVRFRFSLSSTGDDVVEMGESFDCWLENHDADVINEIVTLLEEQKERMSKIETGRGPSSGSMAVRIKTIDMIIQIIKERNA